MSGNEGLVEELAESVGSCIFKGLLTGLSATGISTFLLHTPSKSSYPLFVRLRILFKFGFWNLNYLNEVMVEHPSSNFKVAVA